MKIDFNMHGRLKMEVHELIEMKDALNQPLDDCD